MKSFYKFYAAVIALILFIFAVANSILLKIEKGDAGRPYRVEAERLAKEIEEKGLENISLGKYQYIINIDVCQSCSALQGRKGKDRLKEEKVFYEGSGNDYIIRKVGPTLFRFDYRFSAGSGRSNLAIAVNAALGVMSLLIFAILAYIQHNILKPFQSLRQVPYELSRGNLAVPIKESRHRYFGKFAWGINMLRENMEQQKQRELALIHDKKTLVLSISHDIKTPLSAIKLYAQALSRGLYKDAAKKMEIAESINDKADEIEKFVSQIIKASNEDFLNLEAKQEEFYLSALVHKTSQYYKDKLSLVRISFSVGSYEDCILKGDFDRSIEVLQNLIENAVKYGDGHSIELLFAEESGCQLVTVKNSGCTLPETELHHIFDSFWRGSNAGSNAGSGLGLAICRQLMHLMNGDIFAEIQGDAMRITLVFIKS